MFIVWVISLVKYITNVLFFNIIQYFLDWGYLKAIENKQKSHVRFKVIYLFIQ